MFDLDFVCSSLNIFRSPCLSGMQGISINPFLLRLVFMLLLFNLLDLGTKSSVSFLALIESYLQLGELQIG